jgi:hypothetical protein
MGRTMTDAYLEDFSAQHLKRRADSYWRDASVLDEIDAREMAIAYRTIARELRTCAEEMKEN